MGTRCGRLAARSFDSIVVPMPPSSTGRLLCFRRMRCQFPNGRLRGQVYGRVPDGLLGWHGSQEGRDVEAARAEKPDGLRLRDVHPEGRHRDDVSSGDLVGWSQSASRSKYAAVYGAKYDLGIRRAAAGPVAAGV